MTESALNLLVEQFNREGAEKTAETLNSKIPPRSLRDMRVNRSEELLKDRFLCKGGGMLLVGPTGVGKSSLSMQLVIAWALGRDCFGITPVRPLTTLLIQAENDDGDIAEQRDGVLAGMGLTDDEKKEVFGRILVVSENTKSGDAFIIRFHELLEEVRPDMVIVDPALAYIGGDVSAQKDVGPFLRNKLNPIIKKYQVGLVVVHHTNKPLRGKEKDNWKTVDFAYLGAGSAEWANWSRAIVCLQGTSEYGKFVLIAGKRGQRLRWVDESGGKAYVKGLSHSEPGTICWREIPMSEITQDDDKKISTEQKMANLWLSVGEELTKEEFFSRGKAAGVHSRTIYRWWTDGPKKKVFRKGSGDTAKLTGKFQPDIQTTDINLSVV
jgi:hypothetical protein